MREKITGREEKSQSFLDTKWYVNKLQQKKTKILFSKEFIVRLKYAVNCNKGLYVSKCSKFLHAKKYFQTKIFTISILICFI